MPKPAKRCCKCGETNPRKFSPTHNYLCITHSREYEAEYYELHREEKKEKRRNRYWNVERPRRLANVER